MVRGLAAMAAGHASPQARLHALNVLEGLAALEAAHLESALEDSHPEVRVHAVRLSEAFPELTGRLAAHSGGSLASGPLSVGSEPGRVLGSRGGPGAGQAGPRPLR